MTYLRLALSLLFVALPLMAEQATSKKITSLKEKTAPKMSFLNDKKDDLHGNISIPHEKYILPNGLTVILSEDHSAPFVATSIWYNVGSVNEQPQKTGLAHLFEHLMFEGSVHMKDDAHFVLLDGAGAYALNATTSIDRTNYFQTVPKNQLELALALESSRMYFLDINQAKLDEQRAVVRREREQRFETSPYGLATLHLWQKIFPENHPMYGRIIGSHKDLEAAKLKDVKAFYDRYYGPTNASLTLVGDFQKEPTKALIAKYFGSLPKSKVEAIPKIPEVKITGQEIINYDEKLGRLPLVRIQYLTPALFQAGDADLDIAAHILGGGENGRLNKALTRDKPLAGNVSVYQQSMEQISVFTIDVLLNPGVNPNDVIATIDQVMLGVSNDPPKAVEIERGRNIILTNYYFALQEFGGSSGKAEALQSYNRFAKDPGFMQKDLARYQAVDQKTIVDSVQKYLPTNARKILIATPQPSQVAHKE
jgi:zinc protease